MKRSPCVVPVVIVSSHVGVWQEEMESKRVSELQTRVERERVRAQLQDIDRAQLRSMEEEKKRELEVLIKEREIIREKEERTQRQLAELEQKLLQETEEFKAKQQQNKRSAADTADNTSGVSMQHQKFEARAKVRCIGKCF